jgi:hypothetical protein
MMMVSVTTSGSSKDGEDSEELTSVEGLDSDETAWEETDASLEVTLWAEETLCELFCPHEARIMALKAKINDFFLMIKSPLPFDQDEFYPYWLLISSLIAGRMPG